MALRGQRGSVMSLTHTVGAGAEGLILHSKDHALAGGAQWIECCL